MRRLVWANALPAIAAVSTSESASLFMLPPFAKRTPPAGGLVFVGLGLGPRSRGLRALVGTRATTDRRWHDQIESQGGCRPPAPAHRGGSFPGRSGNAYGSGNQAAGSWRLGCRLRAARARAPPSGRAGALPKAAPAYRDAAVGGTVRRSSRSPRSCRDTLRRCDRRCASQPRDRG